MDYDQIFKEAAFKLGMLHPEWNQANTKIKRSSERSFIADLVYEVENLVTWEVVKLPVSSTTLQDYHNRYIKVAQ